MSRLSSTLPLQALTAQNFLEYSFEQKFKHTNLLQADGGPEFKDDFKKKATSFASRLRVARSYRKNEQAYIEAFNRSLRKECLGWGKYRPKDIPSLQKEVDDYMVYYHTKRAHLAHNLKTPNEVLAEHGLSDI